MVDPTPVSLGPAPKLVGAEFLATLTLTGLSSALATEFTTKSQKQHVTVPIKSKLSFDSPLYLALQTTLMPRKNSNDESRNPCFDAPGRTYVGYACPGMGKSAAANILFGYFLKTHNIRGIMISGLTSTHYPSAMMHELGRTQTDDKWISSLIAALERKRDDRGAPVLLLDDFNSYGENGENIDFIFTLMQLISHGKGFYVIILTQNIEVAKKLVALNAWQKIAPLASFYRESTEPEDQVTENLAWIDFSWSKEQLRAVVDCSLGVDALESYEFLHDGMTPTEANKEAQEAYLLIAKEQPNGFVNEGIMEP